MGKIPVDFITILKDLRTKDNVACPLCQKGHFIPVGKKETAHGFYCSNCKEKLKID